MKWLGVVGFLAWSEGASQNFPVEPLEAPVLKWRLDVTPERENSTASEYSGVATYGEYLYIGLSNKNGILIVDKHLGVPVGVLDTSAPIQSTPLIISTESGTMIVVSDLAGDVTAWSIPVSNNVHTLQVLKVPELVLPDADLADQYTKLWVQPLNIPVMAPLVGDSKHIVVSTNEDVVYALGMDGDIQWRVEHQTSPSRSGNLQLFGAGKPLLTESHAVVGFSDGGVLTINRQTGLIDNNVFNGDGRYPDVIAAPALIQGGLVVSGFEKPMWKQSSQSILWEQEVGAVESILVEPTEGNQTIIYHPGADGILRKVDTTSGAILWTWDSEEGSALTEPQFLNKNIILTSHSGGVYLIDSEDGTERWRTRGDFRREGVLKAPSMDKCGFTILTRAGFLERYQTCSTTLTTDKLEGMSEFSAPQRYMEYSQQPNAMFLPSK